MKIEKKMDFENYKRAVKNEFEKHLNEGGFDINDCKIGERIRNFPVNILLPDSKGEWDDAKRLKGEKRGPIKVEIKNGYFYINDGHNRVMYAISNGQKYIDAIIAYKK
jgi:hypothetical protein